MGEYVLVRRADHSSHKLTFRWIGPRRILRPESTHVFLVETLDKKTTERIHVARLRPYSALAEGDIVPPEVLNLADQSTARYDILSKIVTLAAAPDGLCFQLEWDGLPDKRDYTWSPIATVYENVPELTEAFLRTAPRTAVKRKAVRQLGISL